MSCGVNMSLRCLFYFNLDSPLFACDLFDLREEAFYFHLVMGIEDFNPAFAIADEIGVVGGLG